MIAYAGPAAVVFIMLVFPALYVTWDLHRMRKEVQRMIHEIEVREAESVHLYEAAREVYRDAAARWSYVVKMESRIH